jgi:hypothetical protein
MKTSLLLLAALLFSLACSPGGSGGGGNGTRAGTPKLTIVSPQHGATVDPALIVDFEVENWVIGEEGEHHMAFTVNGGPPTYHFINRPDCDDEGSCVYVTPGVHTHDVQSIGETNSGSDHPNPTQPQSHPAITPSTDLLPSQPQGHFARNPTP